uniref:F-box domain-containing protein n=2 Tax=Chelydra serpentina TaxID=8475 RepID=A0A8C3T6B0_CHESE
MPRKRKRGQRAAPSQLPAVTATGTPVEARAGSGCHIQLGRRTRSPAYFPFSFLPVDCQLHVFSFLSEVEKCTAALVCEAWSKLIRTPRLWRVADFMRLGAFQSGMDLVLVSAREFERWKEWVHQYAYHLTSRSASLLVLRASFDLGDQKTKWADFLSRFLDSVHCGELQELELNWTLTHLEPPDFYPPGTCSMTQVSLTKMDQISNFQTLLEKFIQRSPKLTRMKLPFDWSAYSVAMLTQFQQLHSLELKYFWSFKGVCPEIMQDLTKALPNLKTLILHVLVPVKDLGISYSLESRSLEYLDVSQSRGLVFCHLDLPSLRVLRIKKTVRGIILNRRTRLALQSRWSCLYSLLRSGTPNLRVFNNQVLLPHWREQTYKELNALLLQSCYCVQHSDTWLL